MSKGTVIAIGGPTASGKTQAAVEIALAMNTEIISADSRQFYREMSIGTARPTALETDQVKHHFVGHMSITESMSAGVFADEALPVLNALLDRTGCAVVVGGSGLYMDALCYGLDPLPPSDAKLRAELERRVAATGLEDLVEELTALDPVTVRKVDTQNPHRVIRALEICLLTGKPLSKQKQGVHGNRPERDFDLRKVAIHWEREELYKRINTRVDRMMKDGLLDEVCSLIEHRHLPALNTVGYKELFLYLDAKSSLDDAVSKIKQHTRNYAKRQLTWMRRTNDWEWFARQNIVRSVTAR